MQTVEPIPSGQKAPNFTFSSEGKHYSTGEPGKHCLVYFYPKDDTPGCTKEACAFRDAWGDVQAAGLLVVGVSPDSESSHDKFRQKYQLPFPLYADEGESMARAFGVWGEKQFMGRRYEGVHRTSFLIAPDGKILKTYIKVKPEAHAKEVLDDLQQLESKP